MSRRIYRYTVPADYEWHTVSLRGPVVFVESRSSKFIEVWAVHDDRNSPVDIDFRVFGTGDNVEKKKESDRSELLLHVGSAIVAGGLIVLHLVASVHGNDQLTGRSVSVLPLGYSI